MDSATCAICLDDLVPQRWFGPGRPARLCCEHNDRIHEPCLARWLTHGDGCPLCRAPGAQRVQCSDFQDNRATFRVPTLAAVLRVVRWVLTGLVRSLRALLDSVEHAQARLARLQPTELDDAVTIENLSIGLRSLPQLRELALELGVSSELGRYRRPGERLSVRRDYAAVLTRLLEATT